MFGRPYAVEADGDDEGQDQRGSAGIPCGEVARSVPWYAEILGFAADSVGPKDDPVFSILRRDSVEIKQQKVIHGVAPARSATTAGGGWDAYIRIDDVEAFRVVIQAKLSTVKPIVLREYGCRELALTDPDGHVIVLGECG